MRTDRVPDIRPRKLALLVCFALGAAPARGGAPATVDFSRDVLPIFAENCSTCHGPDANARKADLRLDQKTSALRTKDPVVVPGKSAESELIARVTSNDADERMPPPKSSKTLTPAQIDILRRWVDQGASWGKHLAFESPRALELPAVKNAIWVHNAIDRFVLARLESEGLTPSPEADQPTLIRRVSLTLTGLPPTPAEVDAYLVDIRPDAYNRLVDRLLDSPDYDERMAMEWLDKGLHRRIVTCATFRQSSKASPSLVQRDPENHLLARGPRFRLQAELVRDNALAVAGLLTDRTGGPSVKPYQPAGLWEELAGGAGEAPYVQSKGPDLYRRSLFLYRKRTVPHPAMANFDAPSREVCQVKRPRTNTPLQALELLNDVTYVEAARKLAQRVMTEGPSAPAARLTEAFRRATARAPSPAELDVLRAGLDRYRAFYASDRDDADRLTHQGDSPVPPGIDPVEFAAYTAAAGVILNLDETITIE